MLALLWMVIAHPCSLVLERVWLHKAHGTRRLPNAEPCRFGLEIYERSFPRLSSDRSPFSLPIFDWSLPSFSLVSRYLGSKDYIMATAMEHNNVQVW